VRRQQRRDVHFSLERGAWLVHGSWGGMRLQSSPNRPSQPACRPPPIHSTNPPPINQPTHPPTNQPPHEPKAGTFEERDATEWAKDAIRRALTAVATPGARVTAVAAVTGHASLWFIRGSKRAGFEFDLDLTWTAGEGEEAVQGTLKLMGASPDDLEDIEPSEVAVSERRAGRGASEAAAVSEAKRLAGPIREALEAFYAELRQR